VHIYSEDAERIINGACDIVMRSLDALQIGTKYELVMQPGHPELMFLEQEIELPIPHTGYIMRGIVDALLRDKDDGSIAVVDWKIRSKFQSHDYEAMIPQLAIYQYMVRKVYGINTHLGIVFNVKSVPPKSPQYNKNGTPNKNYLKYEWTRPVMLYRSPENQGRMWENLEDQVRVIDDLRTRVELGGRLPMMLGWQCGHCEFRNLCHAEVYGQDKQYIMDTMYIPRRDRRTNEAQSQAR